ncbi:MAG TPA: hypothetical protein V6D20_08255 [Candidatus Obscuribacterales bacterium]
MSIQKFPLTTIQKVRQYIQSALVLPESEQQPPSTKTFEDDQEVPEPESLDALGDLFKFGGPSDILESNASASGRWLVSAVNPADALIRLPGLTMKEGLRLVGYIYRSEKNGKGVVWAVPEVLSVTAELEKALSDDLDLTHPPQPKQALKDVMESIEGDRSVVSFMVASILRREMLEFGSAGKHCRWTHHRLIDGIPNTIVPEWRTEPPQEFSPRARIFPDGRAAVEFFTCRVAAPTAIFRHIDQYPADSYVVNSLDRAIALVHRRS